MPSSWIARASSPCRQAESAMSPFAVLPQDVFVHARAVVVAIEVGGRDERDEIAVAGEVLREEHEVERLSVAL